MARLVRLLGTLAVAVLFAVVGGLLTPASDEDGDPADPVLSWLSFVETVEAQSDRGNARRGSGSCPNAVMTCHGYFCNGRPTTGPYSCDCDEEWDDVNQRCYTPGGGGGGSDSTTSCNNWPINPSPCEFVGGGEVGGGWWSDLSWWELLWR